MISNDAEYKETLSRVEAAEKYLAAKMTRLAEEGFSELEIKRLLDPMRSFYLQFAEEAEFYKKQTETSKENN